MAITDKKTGVWGLDQTYNKINQGSIWSYNTTANLYTWGRNEFGQLGLNQATSLSISSPTQVPGSWGANDGMTVSGRKVSARNHVLNIKGDGTLWTWGSNNKGQLGQSSIVNYSSPIQIGSDTNWSSLGDLEQYAISTAIKTDGTLWVWGDGDSKQQYGAMVDRSSPTQVPGTTWSASFTGKDHIGGIKTDGTLWLWGTNKEGQLGQNDTTDSYFPLQVPGTTWVSVTGTSKSTLATKSDGTLWSWGHNDYSQLGHNQPENSKYSSPVQIPGTTWTSKITSSSTNYVLAIKTDGTMWGWGRNWAGNLGDNTQITRSSPTQIPGSTWRYVAAGNYLQSFAIKTDGTMWSWGNNRYGALANNGSHPTGTPGNDGVSSPTQIPGTWDTVIGAGGADNGAVALKSA